MARKRRSGFLDAIESFNAAYDTVDRVGRAFQQSSIMNEKPEVSTGYTAEQGTELERAAAAGDHVGWDEGAGAYTVTPRLGQDEMGPAMPRTVAPGQVTDFMGERTAGLMTPQQVRTRQQDALIDLETKYNPVKGLKMRQDADQAAFNVERQGRERKAWEREDKALATEEEASAFAMSVMENPDGEQARSIRTLVNRQGRDLAARFDPETGATVFDFNTPDGADRRAVPLSPHQMAQLAYGYTKLQKGDVAGLQVLSGIDKELAATVAAEFQTKLLISREQREQNKDKRDQTQLDHTIAKDNATLDLQTRTTDIAEAREAREARPKQAAVADLEGVLGRKLSKQERERAAGMDKEETAEFKAKLAGLEQMNKNGQFQTPEAYNTAVERLFQERANERAKAPTAGVVEGLKRAQANGELDKAIAQLRQRGVADERIQELVKQLPAQDGAGKASGNGVQLGNARASMPAPTTGAARPADSVQQAYDEWQASKGSWFRQQTPRSAERERAAKQRYEELLRNPQSTFTPRG